MPRRRRPDLGRRSQSNVRRATSRANRTDDQRETDKENSRIAMSVLRYLVSGNEVDRLRMQRVRANRKQQQQARHNEIERIRTWSAAVILEAEATPRKRGRPKKDQNSLVDDLQYSDSGSSGLEEVEQKYAAEAMVQLSVRPDEDLKSEQTFDTSEFLIKREVPDEPPQMSDDLVDLDQHSRDYIYPAVVKEEPMETDINIEVPLLDNVPGEHPQFKEEPPENWQPEPAIQDDLQVTDSEEEAEDGLWF